MLVVSINNKKSTAFFIFTIFLRCPCHLKNDCKFTKKSSNSCHRLLFFSFFQFPQMTKRMSFTGGRWSRNTIKHFVLRLKVSIFAVKKQQP